MRGRLGLAVILLLLDPPSTLGQACSGVIAQVAGSARCLMPGDSFRDCPTCPEMVVVPAGELSMGSDEASDETPIHTVTFAKPFAVGKFELTFAQWDACVAEGGCVYKPDDHAWGRDARPVINVSWNDVTQGYAPWLSRKAGGAYRLLTESEWEYAARGGTRTTYAWGDAIGIAQANCDGCGSAWDNKQTSPVGSFAPNRFGLHDMHGNLWEWTQDCYVNTYVGSPVNGTARTKPKCETLVVRGGGWSDRPVYLRSAIRYGDPPDYRSLYVGARVARAL